MAKPSSIEAQLREIEQLADSLERPDTRERLKKLLAGRTSVAVAKAATLLSRIPDHDGGPDLVAAFHRFMAEPAKTDKGCLAKLAVVQALLAGADPDEAVLRIGIRHVQLEPTWGGRADTAAPLRAQCALGLVQVGAGDVLDELAVLLADPESDARLGAVRALAACGAWATPLLRYKALVGDDRSHVTAECLSGLMAAAPEESFGFVTGLIDPARPGVAAHAAMAVGESRRPGAFELLEAKWEETFEPDFRQDLLLPIAMTRHEEAPSFLVSVLESGDLAASTVAIAALAIYRGDPGVRARAEGAIRGPHRRRLLGLLERAFGEASSPPR